MTYGLDGVTPVIDPSAATGLAGRTGSDLLVTTSNLVNSTLAWLDTIGVVIAGTSPLPGFGAVLALLAIAVALFLARRKRRTYEELPEK